MRDGIIWLPCVDSTNSEALRRLPELPSGSVLAAREQTAGRGQRGNRWFSAPGENLTFSIVLKGLEIDAASSFRLNYISSLAVADFLSSLGVKAKIKWPNDIYVGKRKICGMLIENRLDGEGKLESSVIGIGINVNQKEFGQLAMASSVSLLTGEDYNLETALAQFLDMFDALLPGGLAGDKDMERRYSQILFQRGVQATYTDLLRGVEFRGVIEGVARDGCLKMMDIDSAIVRYYSFKELSYIL